MNVKWKWDAQCHKAFEEAKQTLTEAPVLAHYDPSCPLKLAADASAYRIGAIIMKMGLNVLYQEH